MTVTVTLAPLRLACLGKHPFKSGAAATKVAERQNRAIRRRKTKSRPLGAYRCQHCGFFHIGGEARRVIGRKPRAVEVAHDGGG